MDEIAFDAKLAGEGPSGASTFLYLPKAATTYFGERGRVVGRRHDQRLRVPLVRIPHSMVVNKAVRTGAKTNPGDTVRIVLRRRDVAPRTVDVPKDLRAARSKVPPRSDLRRARVVPQEGVRRLDRRQEEGGDPCASRRGDDREPEGWPETTQVIRARRK